MDTGVTVTVGFGITVTVTVAVLEHPVPAVPVTVYTVVVVGLADTVAPVPDERPVVGLHVYVLPPPAVNETDCPLQITGALGVAVITAVEFTVTATVVVLVHPLASVPVTVYVVVLDGLADTTAPLPEERPVEGLQT